MSPKAFKLVMGLIMASMVIQTVVILMWIFNMLYPALTGQACA